LSTVLVSILVPELIDCCLMLFMRVKPSIPSGNPGKFSMMVVVVSCQPAAIPHAINHSYIKGLSMALAV